MIGIGIPTYNEAPNIGVLLQQIDAALVQLDIPALIINSDNCSPDGTSAVFKATATKTRKIALIEPKKGKGNNLKRIFEKALEIGLEGCVLIDGDVRSFNKSWLTAHLKALNEGSDYTIPNYSRFATEGNTTNHFAYPLLDFYSRRKGPRQPIAGDFGLSLGLLHHLMTTPWPIAAEGYGVDIFITMEALFNDFKVQEVSMDRKIHNPSFDKMIPMFVEVATSFLETKNRLDLNKPRLVNIHKIHQTELLQGGSLSKTQLLARKQEAQALYRANKTPALYPHFPDLLSAENWAEILAEFDRQSKNYETSKLAQVLLPFFLLRTVTYLEQCSNVTLATEEIVRQGNLVKEALARR